MPVATRSQFIALFGDPQPIKSHIEGEYLVSRNWFSQSVVRVASEKFSQLGAFYLHYKVVLALYAVFEDLSADTTLINISTYYPRDSRESKTKYTPDSWKGHLLAVALDLNHTKPLNQFNRNRDAAVEAAKAKYGEENWMWFDQPATLVKTMKSNGFIWGGDWTSKVDPMHFEPSSTFSSSVSSKKDLIKIMKEKDPNVLKIVSENPDGWNLYDDASKEMIQQMEALQPVLPSQATLKAQALTLSEKASSTVTKLVTLYPGPSM